MKGFPKEYSGVPLLEWGEKKKYLQSILAFIPPGTWMRVLVVVTKGEMKVWLNPHVSFNASKGQAHVPSHPPPLVHT